MKIHIVNPNKMCFAFMEKLFTLSAIDIGHEIVFRERADLIIWIQYGDTAYKAEHPEQLHALMQVEDWLKRPDCIITEYKPSGFDATWGFDLLNPHESYLPLGYHPALKVNCQKTWKKQIGLLGGLTQRRKDWNAAAQNKFDRISGWEYEEALRKCAECKANVHIHSYQPTQFTPWDRFARLLHAGIFFVSEHCYCPMKSMEMFPSEVFGYDSDMDYWLSRSAAKLDDMAADMQSEYIRDFDMRKLLEQKLKEVGNV